jgi:hypothetical protein
VLTDTDQAGPFPVPSEVWTWLMTGVDLGEKT